MSEDVEEELKRADMESYFDNDGPEDRIDEDGLFGDGCQSEDA